MRTCTSCKETKAAAEFYVCPKRVDAQGDAYVLPACKACTRSRTARWNETHRTPEVEARWNVAKLAQKRRIKDAAFAAYGGYVCKCCGETEREFLSLDHINNDGADWRRERFGHRNYAGHRTYWWLSKHGYPEGFQVLCMNCNIGKKKTGICPHQANRNDYPLVGVEPSGSKRSAPRLGEDIVSSVMKVPAAN